jgi:TP901-1 family phage major tail protein
MPAQTGLTFGLFLNTGSTGTPTWTALAGLRTRSFKINNNPVDVTTADSASRFRELLGDTGVVELEIDGSGVYQKDAPTHALPAAVSSGAAKMFKFNSASSSAAVEIVGTFVVSEFEISATYNEAATFTVKFLSTGAPTITYSPAASTIV